MRELNQLPLPKTLASFVSLNPLLSDAITSRNTFLMNLSGYPVGNHAVGRIMSVYFSSSDYTTMLNNIKRLRDITRYTADLILTNPMFKADKHALNRTELIAYIEQTALDGPLVLTPTEKDFIAYLIISPETGDAGWTLEMSDDGDYNRILQFHKLYNSIKDSRTPIMDEDGKAESKGDDYSELAVFDPTADEVTSFTKSPRMKALLAAYKNRTKASKDTSYKKSLAVDYNQQIEHAKTIQSIAALRVVDHLFMLLNDMSIWKAFVTPRTKVDQSVNIERARGIKTLSAYLHSILMYPQVFSLELFLGTYRKLNLWVPVYSSVPLETMALYEHAVKEHDYLQASHDSSVILQLLDQDSNNPTKSSILGLPLEFIDIFGLEDVKNQARLAKDKIVTPITIDNLKTLNNREYDYYVMAAPISNFNIARDLTTVLTLNKAVAHEIDSASVCIQNGLTRYYTEDISARLHRLKPSVPFGFSMPIPSVDNHNHTTESKLEGGKMHYTPLTPARTYTYQEYLRNDVRYTVFTSDLLVHGDGQARLPKLIINEDQAKHLRSLLHKDFQSLMPTSLVYGDTLYNKDQLSTGNKFADREAIRRLFETMSGMNFSIIERELGSEHIKRLWATYLSSFALLYVVPADAYDISQLSQYQDEALASQLLPYLVEGHGYPYGTTYSALASKQREPKTSDFIMIAPGVSLRFLNEIPMPTSNLKVCHDFYLQNPYYYYASNSETMSVDNWVMTDGLQHMALAPKFMSYTPSPMLMTPNLGYLNGRLLQQMDMLYKIPAPGANEAGFSIPVSTKPWVYDRFMYNVNYKTWGSYVEEIEGGLEIETTPITTIIESIEKSVAKADQEAADAASHYKPINNESLEPVAHISTHANDVDLSELKHNPAKTESAHDKHKHGHDKENEHYEKEAKPHKKKGDKDKDDEGEEEDNK
jgi:hypothetical protein